MSGRKIRGVDIAIGAVCIVIIACAFWAGFESGRQSVVHDMQQAIDQASEKLEESYRQTQEQMQDSRDTFDGSGYSETGAGAVTLHTAAASGKEGSVLTVEVGERELYRSIGIDYLGGDGAMCSVYVDGSKATMMSAGEDVTSVLPLSGSMLDPGVHTVEVVALEGDAATVYKSAQYEVVR